MAMDEAAGGIVDLLDLPYVAASGGNALALRDNMDVSNYNWNANPFSLLSARAS